MDNTIGVPTRIHWIVIYPRDSAMQRLNNWGQSSHPSIAYDNGLCAGLKFEALVTRMNQFGRFYMCSLRFLCLFVLKKELTWLYYQDIFFSLQWILLKKDYLNHHLWSYKICPHFCQRDEHFHLFPPWERLVLDYL